MGDVVPMQFKGLTQEEFAKLTDGIDVDSEIKRATKNLKQGGTTMTEMEPIETRLRAEAKLLPNDVYYFLHPLLNEAADEIERLRKELAERQ